MQWCLVNQVIAGFWVLSIVGSWCNFLTLFYMGSIMGLLIFIFFPLFSSSKFLILT